VFSNAENDQREAFEEIMSNSKEIDEAQFKLRAWIRIFVGLAVIMMIAALTKF